MNNLEKIIEKRINKRMANFRYIDYVLTYTLTCDLCNQLCKLIIEKNQALFQCPLCKRSRKIISIPITSENVNPAVVIYPNINIINAFVNPKILFKRR